MPSVERDLDMMSLENRGDIAGGPVLEPRAFRNALALYASGITVIAGHDSDVPLGFTCQSSVQRFHRTSADFI